MGAVKLYFGTVISIVHTLPIWEGYIKAQPHQITVKWDCDGSFAAYNLDSNLFSLPYKMPAELAVPHLLAST